MAKKTVAIAILLGLTACGSGCKEVTPTVKSYPAQAFVTRGFWLPDEIDEEAFALYKGAGLNTVEFINHNGEKTSEKQYYLGSERTKRALELCKGTNLKAYISYGRWKAEACGETGFADNKAFSRFDLYEEYRDIITGVHIEDEPNATEMEEIGNDTLTADYRSVYSVPYVCNLYPSYANMSSIGYSSYEAYLEDYGQKVLADFSENRYISVDYYPFGKTAGREGGWLKCYEQVAETAKVYDAQLECYIQTAVGTEFSGTLTETDIRLQVNAALCYGAQGYSYYCYSVPYGDMYEKCLLGQDGKPTELYDYAKTVNEEAQSMASAMRAFSWTKTLGITDISDGNGSVSISMMKKGDYSDRKYLSNVSTKGDILIGCFDGATELTKGDEGYMLVNFCLQDLATQSVTLTLKNDVEYVAVYGGIDKQNASVIKAEKGKITLNIKAGEGLFIVPLR